MSNLAMIALQPHPAVHPGALVPDPADSPLHRDPTIIGCGACAIMGAQHEKTFSVTPEISARAQYRIDGARIRGRIGGQAERIRVHRERAIAIGAGRATDPRIGENGGDGRKACRHAAAGGPRSVDRVV